MSNDVRPLPKVLSGLLVRPENSDLSEKSLEDLCITLVNLKLKDGKSFKMCPTHWIFTPEILRKFFGWTDEDFKDHG